MISKDSLTMGMFWNSQVTYHERCWITSIVPKARHARRAKLYHIGEDPLDRLAIWFIKNQQLIPYENDIVGELRTPSLTSETCSFSPFHHFFHTLSLYSMSLTLSSKRAAISQNLGESLMTSSLDSNMP